MLLLSPDTDTIITLTQLERERWGWGTFRVICDLHLFLWLHMFWSCSKTIKSFEPCMVAQCCGEGRREIFQTIWDVCTEWRDVFLDMQERKSSFRSFVMDVAYFLCTHAFSPCAVLSSMTHTVAVSAACKFSSCHLFDVKVTAGLMRLFRFLSSLHTLWGSVGGARSHNQTVQSSAPMVKVWLSLGN